MTTFATSPGTAAGVGDPLFKARTLHTGADLLTDKQKSRIEKLFTTCVESVNTRQMYPSVESWCSSAFISGRSRVG